MPYCTHCGHEVKEDQEICLNCGCYAKPRVMEAKNKEENAYDSYAHQGLIFTAAGLIMPFLLIVGLINSIKGLRSSKNKKEAIIGTIASTFFIIAIIVGMITIIIFAP